MSNELQGLFEERMTLRQATALLFKKIAPLPIEERTPIWEKFQEKLPAIMAYEDELFEQGYMT